MKNFTNFSQIKKNIRKNGNYFAWVNQPSKHQEYHKRHGDLGVYIGDKETFYCIKDKNNFYSMRIPKEKAHLVLEVLF